MTHVGSAKVNLLKSPHSLQGVHNRAERIQKHLRWAVRTLECGKKKVSQKLIVAIGAQLLRTLYSDTRDPTFCY